MTTAICSFGNRGYAILRETPKGTLISVSVDMPPKFFTETSIKVGFHIHEFGDVRSCKYAGDHYNPRKQIHGGLDESPSHMGDLGNLVVRRGKIKQSFVAKNIKLRGKHSVIGRSMVIHAREDDLGSGGHKLSHTTGNSGARVLCGVIGLANSNMV